MPLDCYTRTRKDGSTYVTCKGKDKKVKKTKEAKKVVHVIKRKKRKGKVIIHKDVANPGHKTVSFTKEERKKFGIDERGLEGVRDKKWWWSGFNVNPKTMWRVAGSNFLRNTSKKEEADFFEFLGREKWEDLTLKQRRLKENEILIYRHKLAAAKKDAESMKAVGGEYGEGMKLFNREMHRLATFN